MKIFFIYKRIKLIYIQNNQSLNKTIRTKNVTVLRPHYTSGLNTYNPTRTQTRSSTFTTDSDGPTTLVASDTTDDTPRSFTMFARSDTAPAVADGS